MATIGRYRMYEVYHSAVQSLASLFPSHPLELETVYTKSFLYNYQKQLLLSGRRRNTVSFYLTALRSIFRQAVLQGALPDQPDLFSDVFTGSDATVKRALPELDVALLQSADLSVSPLLERCRDLFMLSIYLQGMTFVDMAHLQASDVHGDVIVYRRKKTNSELHVPISNEARVLLDKYARPAHSNSPYLLSIITLSGIEGRKEYATALHRHNDQLKKLGSCLGITQRLTSYVARHTWATMAHRNGVDVAVVSQGMGHSTEKTTHIYLSSFEHRRLTEANRAVINAILKPIQEGRVKPVVVEASRRKPVNKTKIMVSKKVKKKQEEYKMTNRKE